MKDFDTAKLITNKISKGINVDFIDVRTKEEFNQGTIRSAINIDYYSPDFSEKISLLEKDRTYVVFCRSGGRSKMAARIMEKLGFTNVINLSGGIMEWQLTNELV